MSFCHAQKPKTQRRPASIHHPYVELWHLIQCSKSLQAWHQRAAAVARLRGMPKSAEFVCLFVAIPFLFRGLLSQDVGFGGLASGDIEDVTHG